MWKRLVLFTAYENQSSSQRLHVSSTCRQLCGVLYDFTLVSPCFVTLPHTLVPVTVTWQLQFM